MGDDELRKAVERRAHALWEAAGRPAGRELEHWLQAEEEIGGLSVAGEEDPGVALDDLPPGGPASPSHVRLTDALPRPTVEKAKP
jgi:hypothetical protein